MRFDRFDICSAYYLFGICWHGGQFTKEYAYTSRAEKCGFKPSLFFGEKSLSPNAQRIYKKLLRNLLGREAAECAASEGMST